MADIFVGSVSVGVVPDASNWNNRLRAELVPSSSRVGQEVGQSMSRQISDSMGKAGTESAGAFSDNFRKRLKAALQALPKAELDGDSTKVDRKLQELRARLEELSKTDIIDSDKAVRELAVIEGELGQLARKADGINVRFDIGYARSQLALLKNDIAGAGGGGRGGLLGGMFGGGSDAAGGAAKGGGGVASLGLSNPYILAGVAALAASIAPFLGQAIAGGIVLGLGGALTGIGVIGAVMTGKLNKQFDAFKANAKKDFEEVGAAFVPVLQHILAMAGIIMDRMTPFFKAIMQMIAGPVQEFADVFLEAFTQPAVKESIDAIARSFSALLTALTPEVPGIANAIAHGITAVANAISAHPQAFASFIKFLALIVEGALMAIAWLAKVAAYIIEHFWPVMHQTAVVFDGVRHEIAHIWDSIYNNTIGAVIRIHQGIQNWLSRIGQNMRDQWHLFQSDAARAWNLLWSNTIGRVIRGVQDVTAWHARLRASINQRLNEIVANSGHYWDMVWNNTIGRAIRGIQDLVRLFGTIRGRISGAVANAGTWLVSVGEAIVNGLWNGIKSAWNNVVSWFKGMPHAILHALGIASPPAWSIDAGKHIMGGLLKGIAHGAANVKDFFVGLATNVTGPLKAVWGTLTKIGSSVGGFFSKLFGGGGSGVARWAGVVAQALGMLGLPQSLAPRVLYQMQTESGGNPNSINNWDVNAQRGDPSRGLMQTIGSTFAAYHVAGTSYNIYDPLANVAAALNYARTVYGPSLMRGSMGVGSGHGYDTGGWLPPGVTMAVNRTGESELILSADQLRAAARGGDGGAMYVAHFDGLTGQAIEGHVRTAFAAMSVTQGNLNRQGRRR